MGVGLSLSLVRVMEMVLVRKGSVVLMGKESFVERLLGRGGGGIMIENLTIRVGFLVGIFT